MMSLEEYITQLKAGQLSSETQTYLIQTGIPKVVHIFLKEGYSMFFKLSFDISVRNLIFLYSFLPFFSCLFIFIIIFSYF